MMNDTPNPELLRYIGQATVALWAAEDALRAVSHVNAAGELVVESSTETRHLFDAKYAAEWTLLQYRREYRFNVAKAAL